MTENRDQYDENAIIFAREKCLRIWTPPVARNFGCGVKIDDSLTQEFDWGWVFYLVPQNPEECRKEHQRAAIAFHGASGNSIPVGTKGLPSALEYFAQHPGEV